MNVTKTRVLFLLCSVAAVFAAVIAGWYWQEQRRVEELYAGTKCTASVFIDKVLKLEGSRLMIYASDYSYWDEMVTFVTELDREWAEANIDCTLPTFNATGAAVYNADGVLVYSVLDPQYPDLKMLDLTPHQIKKLFARNPSRHFFTKTRYGILEVRGATIVPTADENHVTPARGYWFVAKLWSPQYLKEISELLTAKTSMKSPVAAFARSNKEAKCREIVYRKTLYSSNGSKLATLCIARDFEEVAIQAASARRSFILLISFTSIIILVLFVFLTRWVTGPVKLLSQALETQSSELLTGLKNNPTEFGQLASLIHSFFEQKTRLENEIQQRMLVVDALRDSQEKHRQLFTNMTEGCAVHQVVYNERGEPVDYTILDVNPAYEKYVGMTREQVIGQRASVIYGMKRAPYLDIYAEVAKTGKPDSFEAHYQPTDRHFSISVTSPAKGQFAVTFADITERRKAEEAIRLHSAAINAAGDLIAILDSSGQIVFANDAFQRQAGYGSDEITGLTLSALWTHLQNSCTGRDAWQAIKSGRTWSGEMPCTIKDGSSFTADITITPLAKEEEQSDHMILIARNITERKEYENLLDYQAHHDSLTDLPNRLLFSEELASIICDPRRHQQSLAVLFIDLDKFKLVNDTLGHQAGDVLLIQAAARLSSCLRESDTLARMGGDEFTVLLNSINSLDDAAVVAERMLEQMSLPFEVGGTKLVIGASIGISVYPSNATDVSGLLKSADAAMYRAKELGRNNYQFFSEEISQINKTRVQMERDLRRAIKQDELEVYYQPIINVNTRQITRAEALLRWNHPKNGIVSPGLFIPVAEETGLIAPMGQMVIETACRQCKKMQDMGYTDFEISVNVSPAQLNNVNFVSDVDSVIADCGLSPHSLNLEITETMLSENDDDELDILSILKALGVKICLDDFGIGYSSLGRLKTLPIVHMKIDGMFIRNIESDRKDKAMTESIIVMAHNLGINVTAEWVEDEEQLAIIRALGCDYAQGYLVSPALPAQAFEEFMRNWTPVQQMPDAA